MNIYVGNLSYRTTEDELREAFGAFGEVTSTAVIKDRDTGQSRGFGFVEMASDSEGQAAIEGMNGADLGGRNLKVNEARPREERPRGGGGGGGYNRGGGGGGGGGGYNRGGGGSGGYDRDRGRDDWR